MIALALAPCHLHLSACFLSWLLTRLHLAWHVGLGQALLGGGADEEGADEDEDEEFEEEEEEEGDE